MYCCLSFRLLKAVGLQLVYGKYSFGVCFLYYDSVMRRSLTIIILTNTMTSVMLSCDVIQNYERNEYFCLPRPTRHSTHLWHPFWRGRGLDVGVMVQWKDKNCLFTLCVCKFPKICTIAGIALSASGSVNRVGVVLQTPEEWQSTHTDIILIEEWFAILCSVILWKKSKSINK